MYNSASTDKIVQCPYNKNHVMPSSSLQRHIVKCEKNYGTNYKIICPYNATHRLSKSEIAEHVETCPTRMIVEVCNIERTIISDSAKSKDESSFASTVDDSYKRQMGIARNARFTYMDPNDESEYEDTESYAGSIGIGRGRIMARRENYVGKFNYLRRNYKS